MIGTIGTVSVILLILVIFEVIYSYQKKKMVLMSEKKYKQLTFEKLIVQIKDSLYQETRKYLEYSEQNEDYDRAKSRCYHLKKSLRQCSYGYRDDKVYVIEIIKDLLMKKLPTSESINRIIPYQRMDDLSVEDAFDILLYFYEQEYQEKALERLITDYQLDEVKYEIEEGSTPSYIITEEEIRNVFEKEYRPLSYEDECLLLAEKIYRYYKGFGVIDRIRDMAIDGVSGGVSGRIDEALHNEFNRRLIKKRVDMTEQRNRWLDEQDYHNYDSVWLFFKGKSIHLAFLSFNSEKELRRVCRNIYRYNKAGQLSENVGYKVNEMADGSRVVVVRPPFSESWGFFVRKFHIKKLDLEQLYKGAQADRLHEWLKYLVKGARISAITGAQGTGKTTILMAMIKYIYGTLTLRIQETAFELHLRKFYPMRNILTFKETDTISGQEGLDLQKKTDGSVNILGEVATDEVSALMLQTAQVASLFTLFTHHAKTTDDLILALRNSLLKCHVFRDEKVAQEQVVEVIQFDIHLDKDYQGNRFVERVTEIIPVKPEFEGKQSKDYRLQDIIIYEKGQYHLKALPTEKTLKEMTKAMTDKDKVAFQAFILSCEKELSYVGAD